MSDSYRIPTRDWIRAFIYVTAVYALNALCEWDTTARLLRAFGGEWAVEVLDGAGEAE